MWRGPCNYRAQTADAGALRALQTVIKQREDSGPDGSSVPLEQLETFAVELARSSGHEVESSLVRSVTYDYKTAASGAAGPRDPVSEIDLQVEATLRQAIAESYAEHGFLGEELGADLSAEDGDEFIWAIDPIDGTSNFLHRYPLFAVSIACLRDGVPIVGAVWSASSHALRPGVYHARRNGPLCFDSVPLMGRGGEGRFARPLVGATHARDATGPATWSGYDIRSSGSAAVECAFVAAGILRCARLSPLSVWDVAGGLVLARAAGKQVLVEEQEGQWVPFERFEPPLLQWRHAIVIGDDESIRLLVP